MSAFAARDGFVSASASDDASDDRAVAAHFGNPIGEQRLLARGRAVVELGTGVVTVTGPDRLSWLNSITSQQLTGLPAGVGTETLVLDQAGRVEHAARVVDDGSTVWLLTERADAAPLAGWLDSMRFMLRVEVADRSAEFATIGWFGEAAPFASVDLPEPPVAEWVDPWAAVTPGGWGYAAQEAHPGSGWTLRIAVVTPGTADAIAASDVPVAGLLAHEALRIAAWRPTLSDADDRTIPHELDWLRSAVHLTKGCYRGQETVAKVHNLGHPPRRVVQLHLDGSDAVLPAPGTPVLLDDQQVGRLAASAVHHELGPIGLAVVKRSLDPTATLTLEADGVVVTAAQETIVPPGAGATANVPRLPRLGAVKRS
ncbi:MULTISPECIES: folate-binding protein YgfZ [unclassified Curtobacterium]|uniref:CAF17-like 4Fe-4S cluster assembly/insertion protein YgfZ n=1 Tax=unclassified Curtobacterium TaxID=257496 RepID=UPI0008DE00A2|nr:MULTISPECIES: glycine cleavage T C-terminal barrel domain-containing protein [unclassified Curtobacterium]OIH98019.1 aminomethyltransferase [Curtobacterium sp. MCBA15_003]OII32859.1 aminomethyltransferase [Curtobacterium sp. MMLR14_006]